MSDRYWETKSLQEMSDEEWEALCDGCGRCCLNKLEDWDTGEIAFTAVACTLLDEWTCRCTDYDKRHEKVPDCVKLTPDAVSKLGWLPDTCAYRVVAEGRPLAWWHPLVSGDAETVHDAGISVMGRVVSEDHVAVEDYEDFIVSWPGERCPQMAEKK